MAKAMTHRDGDVATKTPTHKPRAVKCSGSKVDLAVLGPECSRILVLYCGGTIGMKPHDGVYYPEYNFLPKSLRDSRLFHDQKFPFDDEEGVDNPFVMPLSKSGKRVVYSIYEYEELVESSDMNFEDYADLATNIKENYYKYDAFIILHGTDTMAYTASALSFMLEHLGKMVIVTGAQIPIFETRSDGRDNFLGALIMASHYTIPEVCIYFDNQLLRGNRSTKSDSRSFHAFQTPCLDPLAKLEVDITVDWDAIFRPMVVKPFRIYTKMCPDVGILRLFPGITKATAEGFMRAPMQGIVLQSYGAGDGPTSRKDLMDVIREACARGVIIVNTSQCFRGNVVAIYESGKILTDAGVIQGADMTPEGALMKLSYVLSKDQWPLEKKKWKLSRNLRGELTQTEGQYKAKVPLPLLKMMIEAMDISSTAEVRVVRNLLYPSMLCTAAKEGNIENLEEIRESGTSLNLTDYDRRTALHIACAEGNVDVVRYLLRHGAAVHMIDRYGKCPLHDAARFKHIEIIKLLRGAGAHFVPTSTIGSRLCSAAAYDDVKGLDAWHCAGINLNLLDYDKKTALHMAVEFNRPNCVKFLLEHGAKPDVADKYGNTPLSEAKKMRLDQLVDLLEKKRPANKESSSKS